MLICDECHTIFGETDEFADTLREIARDRGWSCSHRAKFGDRCPKCGTALELKPGVRPTTARETEAVMRHIVSPSTATVKPGPGGRQRLV